MPADRFYHTSIDVPFELEGEEFRHLKVMRVREGEEIEFIDGKGKLALCKILEWKKNSVLIEPINIHQEAQTSHEVIIAQAIPKMNRLDIILEKGTELGMTQLWLFPGEHSEKADFSDNQKARMQHILIASIKQSGRLYLPKIELKPALKQWKTLPYSAYFGDVNPEAPHFIQEKLPQELIFFVGPEKGFTDREEVHLKDLGAKGVKLNRNILRTDTAPLCALSLINAKL